MPAAIALLVVRLWARHREGLDNPARAGLDRVAVVGMSVVLLIIGTYVGYTNAYRWNYPVGLEEPRRFLLDALALGLCGAVGLGIAAWLYRRRRGARVGRLVLGGAGLLGLGVLGGFVVTPVLGIPYSTPLLGFDSTFALRLDGVDWVPAQGIMSASCGDGPVTLLDPGLLQGIGVEAHAHVDRQADHVVGSDIVVSIDVVGTDPPPGQQLPAWEARVRLIEVAEDGWAGRVAFIDMPRKVDPSGAPTMAGWPDTLTGEFIWNC
jgi:hypothetical protein